jgi:hypothetical protein
MSLESQLVRGPGARVGFGRSQMVRALSTVQGDFTGRAAGIEIGSDRV